MLKNNRGDKDGCFRWEFNKKLHIPKDQMPTMLRLNFSKDVTEHQPNARLAIS